MSLVRMALRDIGGTGGTDHPVLKEPGFSNRVIPVGNTIRPIHKTKRLVTIANKQRRQNENEPTPRSAFILPHRLIVVPSCANCLALAPSAAFPRGLGRAGFFVARGLIRRNLRQR